MNLIRVQGGIPLQGKVRVQGSKNAALPILAATLLTKEASLIQNCPKISDVYAMLSLLKELGCEVCLKERAVLIDPSEVSFEEMKSEAVTGMRSSLCLLGAMLGRFGKAVLERPGGCVIGSRPIDLHLTALQCMGVTFHEEDSLIYAKAPQLHGATIRLAKPSVGATENVILAAVCAEGDTMLYGAAKEPEVVALCRYLTLCGAQIEGEGTDCIVIRGGKNLYGSTYKVPADRIVAGTYLFACLGAGGSVFLEEAPAREMEAVLELARKMGARIVVFPDGIYVQARGRLQSPECIVTAPYPGFPTDLQSIALAVCTAADRSTWIEETIFENRMRVVSQLRKMGASIHLHGRGRARVCPTHKLIGSEVSACELRGGAALVVAALMAEGTSEIYGYPYIYRGYENLCRDLRELGARITSV